MSDNLPPGLDRLIEEGVADQSIFTPANRDPRDAENARLRAEVERLKMDVSHRSRTLAWQQRRAESAEAEAEDFKGRYETAHDSRMHAERVLERVEAERDRARNLAANLEAECARLSETVARVEALRDRWRDLADEIRFTDLRDDMSTTGAARALDAALTGPTETVG